MKFTALMTLSIFKAFARNFSWFLMQWYFIKCGVPVVVAPSSINFTSPSFFPATTVVPSVAISNMLTKDKENWFNSFFFYCFIQIKRLSCVFQWHESSHFFSDIIFVISSSSEKGKSSHICSINTFNNHQSIKFQISSFTFQSSFNILSCFFSSPGYGLLRQTDFRKICFIFY